MRSKVRLWFHNLFAAAITGGATSGISTVGLAGAKAVGVDVPMLDLKQTSVLFVSGAVVGLLAYLKQSPLPPINGDTAFIQAPDEPEAAKPRPVLRSPKDEANQ